MEMASIEDDYDVVVIDEIQKVPALLDSVHSMIESGGYRFALSGSSARKLKEQLSEPGQRYFGKVVRDRFSMNLVLKRADPDALVFVISNAEVFE